MNLIMHVVTILIFMINTGCAYIPQDDEQIIPMLRRFYIEYNVVWENATSYKPEEFEEKVFALVQQYCSKNLQSEIEKFYEIYRLEHDLLTNDYGGANSEKLKSTLSVVKDTTKENSYIISYLVDTKAPSAPDEIKNIIHVTVIKEEGNYKIDEVW